MLERIYALRTPAPSKLSLERTWAMAVRWGCAVVESSCDLRDNGGQTLVQRCSRGPPVLLRAHIPLFGVEAQRRGALRRRRIALLLRRRLDAGGLDPETVEFFVCALEASDASTRKEAIVDISLVPALAFVPALRVALGKDRDAKLSAMVQNVLQMCEG